jgi:hypothetical protein
MSKPQARQDDIVVQELFDEVVVYDLKRDKIHALNPTAAFVWQQCDGSRSRQELAGLLAQEFQTPQADALVMLTLDRLEKAHLLAGDMPPTNGHRPITRRELLKMAGVTVALLPVVKSIVAPTVAQAQSTANCVPKGGFCTSDSQCCSLNCNTQQNKCVGN